MPLDNSVYGLLVSIDEPKKIGIIDADLLDHGTRHPNLALMKISSFCRAHNHRPKLVLSLDEIESYDYLFMSCVFSFTHIDPKLLSLPNIAIGGTGIDPDGEINLPFCVEHSKPDYSLYEEWVNSQIEAGVKRSKVADYLDYSIGFLTRGCFRKCSFCVNRKYDYAFAHSPISEFVDERRPYIYLWDDNFLAYKNWDRLLDDLIDTGKPFQFRQGLDIRLMTKAKAEKLASVKYHGDFIFAFDHIEDRKLIEKKLKLWRETTLRGTRLYVLCAFDSQDEQDITNTFERIAILMKYSCLPYIMRYEDYERSALRSLYISIARWCNQPQFFKKMSFRQFCEACQHYHKTEGTYCAAYRSMKEFADEHPDIADKYFDLRYEDLKQY